MHRPVVTALLAELAGAVERVHDPDPGRVEPVRVVRALLGEDRVVRAGPAQRVEDEDVRPRVALGLQRRGVVGGGRGAASRSCPASYAIRAASWWSSLTGGAGIRGRQPSSRSGGELPGGEVGQGDVLEHGPEARPGGDPHVHDPPGRARVREVLGRLAPHGSERPVDGPDHVGHRDVGGLLREQVAALRAPLRRDDPGGAQRAEDVLEELQRDVLRGREVLALDRLLRGCRRELRRDPYRIVSLRRDPHGRKPTRPPLPDLTTLRSRGAPAADRRDVGRVGSGGRPAMRGERRIGVPD